MNQIGKALNLTQKQLKLLKNGGSLQLWDHPETGEKVPMVVPKIQFPGRQSSETYEWTRYDYQEQLELAKQTRIALLAVLAELHRLHFAARDKKAPIEFSSVTLRSLGFSTHDKIRSLRDAWKGRLDLNPVAQTQIPSGHNYSRNPTMILKTNAVISRSNAVISRSDRSYSYLILSSSSLYLFCTSLIGKQKTHETPTDLPK